MYNLLYIPNVVAEASRRRAAEFEAAGEFGRRTKRQRGHGTVDGEMKEPAAGINQEYGIQ